MRKILNWFKSLFVKKDVPDNIPEFTVATGDVFITKLMLESGLCQSGGEAKRLIAQGGVSINGTRVNSYSNPLEVKDGDILKVGKRKFIKLKK